MYGSNKKDNEKDWPIKNAGSDKKSMPERVHQKHVFWGI